MVKGMLHFFSTWGYATKRLLHDKYTYRASALAFTTILTIVPFLLVIAFLIAAFPFFNNNILLGEKYILLNFVPESASYIEYYFRGFIQQVTRLSAFSVGFLILITITLVHVIEETMNDIWRVPKRKRGRKLIALFFHWLVFLCLPFIIGASVFLSSYLFLLPWPINVISAYFPAIVPITINTLIFSLLYIMVPNVKVSWQAGLLGGVVAALLFEIARIAFSLYVKFFPEYAMIYGIFAIIPIFLIWLFIFWIIILFGGLIANIWEHGDGHHGHVTHANRHG